MTISTHKTFLYTQSPSFYHYVKAAVSFSVIIAHLQCPVLAALTVLCPAEDQDTPHKEGPPQTSFDTIHRVPNRNIFVLALRTNQVECLDHCMASVTPPTQPVVDPKIAHSTRGSVKDMTRISRRI